MSEDNVDLEYLTEIIWEIGKRIRENKACEADIEALIAIEFVARTPALKRLTATIIDQACMTDWHDYVIKAQEDEASSCGSTF